MHVSSVLSFSSYKATSPIMGALPPLAQVTLFNPNYLSKVLTLIYIRIWRLAFQHTFGGHIQAIAHIICDSGILPEDYEDD